MPPDDSGGTMGPEEELPIVLCVSEKGHYMPSGYLIASGYSGSHSWAMPDHEIHC